MRTFPSISSTFPSMKLRLPYQTMLRMKSIELLDQVGYKPIMYTQTAPKFPLVGAGMTGIPGVAAKIIKSLVDVGVQVLQSADSHTTIWVLIKEEEIHKAVNALHEAFELNKKVKQK